MKLDIKSELRKLKELQEIDSQIYKLHQIKNVISPALLNEIKTEVEEKRKSLETFEHTVKEIQLKKKQKELDLASKEETISKAQSQLYQLKTNKEYQAKLSEIKSLKADISILEDDVIKVLDEIEKAEEELKIEREKNEQEKKESKEKEDKIIKEQEDAEIKIRNLEGKKSISIKEIDKVMLSKYEKLLKTRAGLALVPIINESCGACFMRTNHQKINEIKMYKELVFCDNCVRILYLPEDIEG